MLTIILLILLLNAHINYAGKRIRHEINLIPVSDTTSPTIICPIEIEVQPNQDEWKVFLQNNLQLDSAALDTIPAGRFTVIAQFVIDKIGKMEKVSIVKDPGYGLGDRVTRVLKNYDGCWQPAIINDRETKSYRRQPITFIIEEETKNVCEEQQPPDLIP